MTRDLDHSPLLFAHRGAAAVEPENTMRSFRRALELGADALETDLHMTRDGVIVAAHDPDGQRRAGVPAGIRDVTFAELSTWDVGGGARIPSLEEMITELPGVPINVDVKQREPDMVPTLLALLARLRAEHRVLVTSFSTRTVRRLRHGYRGRVGCGRGDVLALLTIPALCPARRGDAAQLPVQLGQRWIIERAHARGLRVDFWTVNDAATARRLLDLGADGIMTDDPAAVAPAFAGR
jgi:glycerophosphoryl diester phosphodiesterase